MLYYILIGFLGLIGLVVLAAVVGFVWLVSLALSIRDLAFDLPWLTWMTLEDITKRGYTKFSAKLVVMVLYDSKYLEVRPQADLWEGALKAIEKDGFDVHTLIFHEFRLIKRPTKRDKFKISLGTVLGGLQPSPVPVRI